MNRLLRFFELWLDVSCTSCNEARQKLGDFIAKDSAAEFDERLELNLIISKKPGTDGKIHEFHLGSKK